jgi:hypothetical protein
MIGLAIVLIPVGYVLIYTGVVGDGNPPTIDASGKSHKTYSLSNAFRNALQGSLINPKVK